MNVAGVFESWETSGFVAKNNLRRVWTICIRASAAIGLSGSGVGSQFGRPLAVFVTDFSRADLHVSEEGYLRARADPAVGWTRAEDAVFVHDSGARAPGGPAVVPFASRAAAESFVDETGGEILGWRETVTRLVREDRAPMAAYRAAYGNRSARADAQVARRLALRDRQVSVVVGEDAATLAAAVPLARQETISVLAAHATTDSPVLYVRFVVLIALFALVVLAVALGVSAVTRSFRQALALAAAVVLAVVIGLDASLIAGLSAVAAGDAGPAEPNQRGPGTCLPVRRRTRRDEWTGRRRLTGAGRA